MAIKITAPVRIDISGGWPDSDPYRKDFGGIVLNAAINMRVSAYFDGYLKTDPCNVPPHSGLGTSGALRAVEIAASNQELLEDKLELIKKVHKFENEIINHRAGFQDQAAAIYGGMKLWEFRKNGAIKYSPIPIEKANLLEQRIVLIYTGEEHLSGNIHDLVFGAGNYKRNIPRFDRMKEIAGIMADNLVNWKLMGELITETWDLQRSLHESIETDCMRTIQKFAKGLYDGARATGAGGGGCMIFYTNNKKNLIEKFESAKKELPQIRIINFKLDYEGIKLEEKFM